MHAGIYLGLVVIAGFALWGATLFWRGRVIDKEPRHETRGERRRLHHKS